MREFNLNYGYYNEHVGTFDDVHYLNQQTERKANDTLYALPFANFGVAYASFLMQVNESLLNASAQFQIAKDALGFLSTDLYQDAHRTVFAPAISKIYNYQQTHPSAPTTSSEAIQGLRELRRVYQDVVKVIGTIPASTSPALPNPGPGTSAGAAIPGRSNSLGMAFAQIPAGTFMMGSPKGETNRNEDERQHTVKLSHSFEMQATDVTQSQYVQVMGTNPSNFQSNNYCPKTYKVINGSATCANHPVENVSWNDAQVFVMKLNSTLSDGYLYHLPTEAEWEYAARAGTTTTYSFGNYNADIFNYAWFIGNSGNQTHEVAQLRPNPWGLYDMHGNVWQWVLDYFGYGEDYGNAPAADPMGAQTGSDRVLRGGGLSNGAQYLRSAYRDGYGPANRASSIGFRLVRTLR